MRNSVALAAVVSLGGIAALDRNDLLVPPDLNETFVKDASLGRIAETSNNEVPCLPHQTETYRQTADFLAHNAALIASIFSVDCNAIPDCASTLPKNVDIPGALSGLPSLPITCSDHDVVEKIVVKGEHHQLFKDAQLVNPSSPHVRTYPNLWRLDQSDPCRLVAVLSHEAMHVGFEHPLNSNGSLVGFHDWLYSLQYSVHSSCVQIAAFRVH